MLLGKQNAHKPVNDTEEALPRLPLPSSLLLLVIRPQCHFLEALLTFPSLIVWLGAP